MLDQGLLDHSALDRCVLSCFRCARLSLILWTVACQAPPSMGFSRQEYWSGSPCPPPGDLPDPGIKHKSLTSPALTGRFFTTSATWEVPNSEILALILVVAEAVFPLQFRMGSIPCQIDPLWGGASLANTKETGLTLLKYESHSIMSDSLRPHGLYSPWNSPGQDTGVGSFPFFRGSSQSRD